MNPETLEVVNRTEPTSKESRCCYWSAPCMCKIEKCVDKGDKAIAPLQCQSANFFTLKIKAEVSDA